MEIDATKILAGVVATLIGLTSKVGCDVYEEHQKLEVRVLSIEKQVSIQWKKIDDLEHPEGP